MKNLGFLFILALTSTGVLADKNVTTFSNLTVAAAEMSTPISWTSHYTDGYASHKSVKLLEKNALSATTTVKTGLEQQIANLLKPSIEEAAITE